MNEQKLEKMVVCRRDSSGTDFRGGGFGLYRNQRDGPGGCELDRSVERRSFWGSDGDAFGNDGATGGGGMNGIFESDKTKEPSPCLALEVI